MKRALERLSRQRQEKEDAFSDRLSRLHARQQELAEIQHTLEKSSGLSGRDTSLHPEPTSPDSRRRPRRMGRRAHREIIQTDINTARASVEELRGVIKSHLELSRRLAADVSELIQAQAELMEARDKEWDALGSNHVGMIFKSMEWHVDKLSEGYQDAALLMKNYVRLRYRMSRLLEALERQDLPTPRQVKDIVGPLEDIIYAGFENRHRGAEQDVMEQQKLYLPYFQTSKTVLDLGCGRGEFLDLLSRQGIPVEGIDLNAQMIETCRDRGIECRAADILEALAAHPDDSLGGIFSSQVVEHLAPDYLRRLVDLAYVKLAPDTHIVLETINPASVFALVHVYFLDITHRQPVHPQSLKFLVESAGFQDVEIRYSAPLDEEALSTLPPESDAAAVLNRNFDKLNHLLYAPVNYAAVGRKT
jgi:O-antigen chain-terminating methyltransferase